MKRLPLSAIPKIKALPLRRGFFLIQFIINFQFAIDFSGISAIMEEVGIISAH